MIFFAKDRQASVQQDVRGGTGEVEFLHSLTRENKPQNSSLRMVGQVTLARGSSIGFHIHEHDEEVYIITSGTGLYTDTDGQACLVGAGDVTLTRQGEGHALSNTGDQPLVFMAIIIV